MDTLLQNIMSLYAAGMTIRDISHVLGMTHSRIHRTLVRAGVPRRPPCHRTYTCRHDAFAILDAASCYWAGFLAADGCVSGHTLLVELSAKDVNHLEKLKSFLGFSGSVKHRVRQGRPYVRLCVTSRQIIADLEKHFGILPRKSLRLEPPSYVPGEHVRHFVRGLIDGDGCVHKRKSVSLVGTHALLKWVIDKIHKTCGISMHLSPRTRKHTVWNGNVSGRLRALVVLSWLYDGVRTDMLMERKRQAYLQFHENPRRERTLVERVTNAYVAGGSFATIRETCGVGYVKARAILMEQGIVVSRWDRRDERLPMEGCAT